MSQSLCSHTFSGEAPALCRPICVGVRGLTGWPGSCQVCPSVSSPPTPQASRATPGPVQPPATRGVQRASQAPHWPILTPALAAQGTATSSDGRAEALPVGLCSGLRPPPQGTPGAWCGSRVLAGSPALVQLRGQGMESASNPRQAYHRATVRTHKPQLFRNKCFSDCCFASGPRPEP